MDEIIDWNKLTMEQCIEHLESKFQFDSSGTAKAVFELINAYKALSIQRVVSSNFICKSENKRKEKCKEQCAWCDGCN